MTEEYSAALQRLRSSRYLLLTTFRRDGRGMPTPVWFAADGDRLVVFTGAQTGKVKRIRSNDHVTVAACTLRGRHTGPDFQARAFLLPETEGERVMVLIRRKYRLTKVLLDVIVGTIRLARRRPQTHSVYIGIELTQT